MLIVLLICALVQRDICMFNCMLANLSQLFVGSSQNLIPRGRLRYHTVSRLHQPILVWTKRKNICILATC